MMKRDESLGEFTGHPEATASVVSLMSKRIQREVFRHAEGGGNAGPP
jgi:hypothetical protein